MDGLKATLEQDSKETYQNKELVQGKLAAELKDSPNFQALKTAVGDKPGMSQQHSLESRFVSRWASTSGDDNVQAVAMQIAARDAFEMNDNHISVTALGSLKYGEDQVFKSVALDLTGNTDNAGLVRAGMQEYVHGMYRVTQDYLASKGIENVYVARGMGTGDYTAKVGSVKLQPISSFSANFQTAYGFKKGGNVFLTKVPASQVLSTYMTGFGCTGEHEVTVLSQNGMKAFRDKFSGKSYFSTKEISAHAFKLLSMSGE
jgi:hypothetical protein